MKLGERDLMTGRWTVGVDWRGDDLFLQRVADDRTDFVEWINRGHHDVIRPDFFPIRPLQVTE